MTSKDKVNLAMAWYDSGLEDRAAFQRLMESILAQPPQRTEQESVADDFFRAIADRNPKPFPPPQRTWVGLTDEEIQVVAKQARSKDHAVTLTNKLLREKNA
jgi:hypothetical protein